MEKINNWEEIEARGINDFQRLVAGGYVGVIKNAEEHTSETTGNKSLKVECDIVEGEYKDYFQKNYDNNTNMDKRWDNNSTRYIGLGESSLPFFKGFITAVENSNSGYTWNWDEKSLVGKKIGLVYQWEEYEKQDGSTGVKVKLNQFRSVDKVNEARTDNIKLLNGGYMSYNDYNEVKRTKQENNMSDFVEISDEEMPF